MHLNNKTFIALCILFFTINLAYGQKNTVSSENWPGLDGDTIVEFRLSEEFEKNYEMVLAYSSENKSFFYKIPIDEKDSIRKGMVRIIIKPSIKEAHTELCEVIELIPDMNSKPQKEDVQIGDVFFRWNNESIDEIAFVRNNIIILIRAEERTAQPISLMIDKEIIRTLNIKK